MTDVLSRASGLPDAVVRYADHSDGLVDLHLPGSPPRGLCAVGWWMGGGNPATGPAALWQHK